jgi:hypothetical protein
VTRVNADIPVCPSLSIQPRFRQCAVITPPLSYSGSSSLLHTYNMPEEWYLIQTPSGGIVLGGGTEEMERRGRLGRLGDEDDSFVDEEWTKSEAVASPSLLPVIRLVEARSCRRRPHSHSRLLPLPLRRLGSGRLRRRPYEGMVGHTQCGQGFLTRRG